MADPIAMKGKFNSKLAQVAMLITVFALIVLIGCKKDKEPVSLLKKVTVQLTGAQETPAVTTTGNGTAEITFDPTLKTIAYKITWMLGKSTDKTTGMHFHGSETGDDSKNSGVAIPLTGYTTESSGTHSGTTVALTDVQENQLLAGKWYLNIHSTSNPGGELRGNIKF